MAAGRERGWRPLLHEVCTSQDAWADRFVEGAYASVKALNAHTLAVRPALHRRWADALRAFDATAEVGVLGTDTRGDTVEGRSILLQQGKVHPEAWYGVWLFTDWLDLPIDNTDVPAVAAVELHASLRDPYRKLSRVFHLIGHADTSDS